MSKDYKFCKVCNAPSSYADDYDAHYCAECNIWLEKQCSCTEEDGCPFSRNRPEFPNDIGTSPNF